MRSAHHLNCDGNRCAGRTLRAFIGITNSEGLYLTCPYRLDKAGLKPQPTKAKVSFKFIDRCSVGYNPRGSSSKKKRQFCSDGRRNNALTESTVLS